MADSKPVSGGSSDRSSAPGADSSAAPPSATAINKPVSALEDELQRSDSGDLSLTNVAASMRRRAHSKTGESGVGLSSPPLDDSDAEGSPPGPGGPELARMFRLMGLLWKPHPWHGISLGTRAPVQCTAFIEIVPTDTLKYEIDKRSGYLMIDRPQKFSSCVPAAYGFLPQTLAGARCAALCKAATGVDVVGDNDPLDICVLSERSLAHGNILLQARPIGGLRMIDGGEADDKIIAVMKDDSVFGDLTDIAQVPDPVLKRILHYFHTYKQSPTDTVSKVSIPEIYGAEAAYEVIRAGVEDYAEKYSDLRSMLAKTIFQAVIAASGQSDDESL